MKLKMQKTIEYRVNRMCYKLDKAGIDYQLVDPELIFCHLDHVDQPITHLTIRYFEDIYSVGFQYIEGEANNIKCNILLEDYHSCRSSVIAKHLFNLMSIRDMLNYDNKTTIKNLISRYFSLKEIGYRFDVRKIGSGYKLTLLDSTARLCDIAEISVRLRSIGIMNTYRKNRNGFIVVEFEERPF